MLRIRVNIAQTLCTCLLFIVLGSASVFGIGSTAEGSKVNSGGQLVTPVKDSQVLSDRIVVKFKERQQFGLQLAKTGVASLDQLIASHNISRLEQIGNGKLRLGRSSTSLSINSIYYVYLPSGASPRAVASAFSQDPQVEYAEPIYRHYFNETPNDPGFPQQSHANIILAQGAWDIAKGEQSEVVIAVVDGGVDIDHADLLANIWVNPGEIVGNGVDDDGNGFVDDVRGWNFANNTNNPSGLVTAPESADHGTLVAGITGAVTDNAIGVAGISWNAKIMPINTGGLTDDDGLPFAFEGVLYAINNGADIINMSWGRVGSPSRFEQDIIRMGVEAGIAMVASAGNDANSQLNYPPAYDGVLSVAATDDSDFKANFSNFGTTVDVAAPGVSILGTLDGDNYGHGSGTSFSAPIVSGVIALVRAQNPQYSGLQAAEQVRVTADNIDARNPAYAGLLGSGRVNALRAVSETNIASLRISEVSFNDEGFDGVIQPGESIEINLKFVNFLAPASSVNLTLTSLDPLATVTNPGATIASIGTFEEQTASFNVQVSSSATRGEELEFSVAIDYGSREDQESFILQVQPAFVTADINNIGTSFTSVGRIGFAVTETDPPSGGIGFRFNNSSNLLFEGGIICGTGSDRISNSVRSELLGGDLTMNRDFETTDDGDIRISTNGRLVDEESFTAYNDNNSNTPMDLRIEQETFAMTDSPNDDFILIRFTIHNEGAIELENFHFGLFFDWDIDEANLAQNIADYDAGRRLGYVYDVKTFAGVRLLTNNAAVSYRAIYNDDQAFENPSWGIYDGFSDAEKWESISSGVQFTQSGPGDVSHTIAAGPINIASQDSIQIGFALLAGTELVDLLANADAAQQAWDTLFPELSSSLPGVPTAFSLPQNYPNPFNPTTSIRYDIATATKVELTIYNMLGQKIRTLVSENKNPGTYIAQWDGRNEVGQAPSGVYFYRLTAGEFSQVRRMLLLR